jgi:HAMP domain-containing protein
MAESHPADELANLRDLLRRLESGDLITRLKGEDVTKQEIGLLRREIARLEIVLKRLNGGKTR